MFLHKLFILGLCAVITASDVFHTVDDYRELRLQHLKRQRRQQPKEISISLTAPLFTSRLFDYGADAGDQELPSGLDVGIKVDLKNPIKIDSGEYQSAFILGNGGVGFDAVSRTYRPNIFSKDSESTPMIVPFWNRNDLRKGGHVWFREISSGRILERGQSEIRYQYDKNVKVLSCLLVTWDRMQPLGNSVLDEENANVFQAAFFFTANHTYVNFIYNNIGWTQGAEAGFVSNKHSMDFSLPTSGTENIMYLEEYGNTGIPGEWMFELQPHRVIRCKAGIKGDICDEECSKGEYGEDCAQCCHCSGVETCNPISGQCPEQQCADCWYGPTCHLKDAVCHDQERNSCVRNAVAYFSMNNCNEQVVECNCLQGYQGDGKVECVDIDECKQEGTCHENAVCTNTPGHFLCQCMEGFTGDGVTECIASFLFPSEGHQELPKSRNAKVSFTLKHPLLIFGKPRNNLIVSNTGLVIVEELSKVRSSDTLDDMKVVGVAPFFGPIDLSRGGKITIAEATEHDILERASKKINQNLEQPTFEATSAVIITYSNVSALDSPASNTFQALVIGGKNKRGENLSFTMILYKNLIWSAGAEAGIMTFEKTNSIHLPGSGTEGIEQLSQLSNIREPGTWLYRIDQESVFPCMQLELQPPYCDAQSPTLVHSNRQSTSFVQQKTTVPVKNTATEFVSVSNSVQQHAKQETAAPPLASKTTSQTSAEKTREPVKQSTVHRPIVSIDPTDFEDLPDDAFAAVSFPPFVTVVPSIFSNEQQKTKPPMPSLVFPETRAPSSAEAPTRQTGRASTPAPAQNKPYKPNVDFSSNEDIDFAPVSDVAPTERPSTIKQVHQPPVVIPHNVPDRVEYTKSRTAPTAAPSIESSTPLRIFPTTKAPKQITKMPKTNPTVSTVDPQSDMFDLDSNQVLDAEGSSGNKTAIIVPTAIVVVWVCLLVLIALFICCKRRRANREFHPMYGPNFGGQPIATGFAMRKASKGYDSSYEDNIEKSAARLSAEMNSFNGQQGRISLYGSYWNLSGGNMLTSAPVTSCSELIASNSSNISPVDSAITTARATPNNPGIIPGSHPSMHHYRYGYGARY